MHFILHLCLPARLSGSLFWRMCYVIQSLRPVCFLIIASWCYKNNRETRFKYNSYRPGTKLVKPDDARDIIVQNIGRVKLADHGVLKRIGLALFTCPAYIVNISQQPCCLKSVWCFLFKSSVACKLCFLFKH